MIFVTGDTHGLREDLVKLNTVKFQQSKDLTKNDYVIICGDFGLLWNNSKEEKRWLQKLKDKNFTTLWVDGNHENFNLLERYPICNWNGGKVHLINDSVIHLMRGQIFELENIKFFTFGGARSVDKALRKENISWWKQEMPSEEEYQEGINNLEKNNWTVDYIFTHDCCNQLKNILQWKKPQNTELNKYFDNLETKVNYKHWYFGHYHEDRVFDDKKHTVLYHDVFKVI